MMLLPNTKVFGGRLKNRGQLKTSSSGGAFTAISDVALASGDAIVCSSYNFRTHQQEFNLITTVEDRDAARGSKYVQSIPGDVFRTAEEWLKQNPEKNVYFFGMGCQAAGFQSYAEIKGFRNRIVVVDIICHGSPSPKIWREYVGTIEKQGKIEFLTFKDKRNGWMKPTAVAIVNGMEAPLNRYVKLFYNRKELRLSCHKCPYTTTERTTDITIGDFWHIEDRIPEQYDEMGTSLFIVHTEKGMKLFEKSKRNLDWFESNTTDCWQLNLEKTTPISEGRKQFWQDYYAHGIDYILEKYGTDTMMTKIKRKDKKTMEKLTGGSKSKEIVYSYADLFDCRSCDWRCAA